MSRPLLRASLVVFIASFCTLVIEIVAGRILAPMVGVSLYTWTSIIGVVLAGISAGAWAGGWLADRRPVPSTLGWLLLASGITALCIGPAADAFQSGAGFLAAIGVPPSLPLRVVILSTILFFLPAFFLGMISPVAVKLAVAELSTTGRTVGRIYAFSTLGSIAGTFVTGFYLVSEFGTRSTMLGVGATLILTALAFGDLLGRAGAAAAASFVLAFGVLWMFGPRSFDPPLRRAVVSGTDSGLLHFEESQYYTIQVRQMPAEDDGRPLQQLELDHLIHSYSDLSDPGYLAYHYLRIFDEVIAWKARQYETGRLLFIGGGGYTLPRLTERTWPGAEIDVVEIDPAVTRAAYRYFGLPRQTSIRTFNEDARWYMLRSDEPYDLIFVDAFNDLSVPYHLTTREFTESLRRRLGPEGAVAANVIDNWGAGRFLASYVRTLQSVFGEENVAVIVEDESDMANVQSTFVVLASPVLEELLAAIRIARSFQQEAAPAGDFLAGERLRQYVRGRRGIVLTDDYVPVDNMLAPLFAERYADIVSGDEQSEKE